MSVFSGHSYHASFDWKIPDNTSIFCFADIICNQTYTPTEHGVEINTTNRSMSVRGYRNGERVLEFDNIGLTDETYWNIQDCVLNGEEGELARVIQNVLKEMVKNAA